MLNVKDILESLKQKKISVEDAETKLRVLTIKKVEDFAKLDVCRSIRKGVPEIVLAENKTPEETVKIASKITKYSNKTIITRVAPRHIRELKKLSNFKIEIYDKAQIVVVKKPKCEIERTGGTIGILTAGTSDIALAEEAGIVAKEMGCQIHKAYDVGIAGLHRLFKPIREMVVKKVDVFIVVAGMEGALPSVIASLVDSPVVGVPSSSGYGYGGKGESALMAMLQSCSLGLATVNIDNGVGAGAFAALVANKIAEARKRG
ncbi:MAG: nickel pincer cofactor biosynthesis protein LarB [Candidatus Bathyarchaeota archaeon]